MHAVYHCRQLKNQRSSRERDERVPVVLGAVLDVDMAYLAEAERDARDNQHDSHTDSGNAEAG